MRVRHLTTGLCGTVIYVMTGHWGIRWDDGTTTDETEDTFEIV